MASTYVNDLRLNEMATGDASGTWGTITNTNLELIGEALGYGTQDCFTSDADATTTVADGATDPARAMYFKVTSSATLTATRTLTIAPNTVSRLQFIENATTGSQSINISQGSGANVTIGSGETKAVYLDGAGSGAAVVDSFATFSVANARFADGSNSAPSISFTSDTNTGIYRGGTDILKFVTAGTDAITIDASQDVTLAGNLSMGDNDILKLGAGGDLQIYHDGSHSIIKDAGTGNLQINAGNFNVNNVANTANIIVGNDGGEVNLYYNGSKKLATTSTGIQVTGNIANASGDLTLDVAGNIVLDADGGGVYFKDAGTNIGFLQNSGANDFRIVAGQVDKDMVFMGNDGGSVITALTLDMSNAGTATFNSEVRCTSATINAQVSIYTDGSGAEIDNISGDFTIDTAGDIILDADGEDIRLKDGGTEWGILSNPNGDFGIQARILDKDVVFYGNDGGATTELLRLDSSDAGTAIFNHDIKIADNNNIQLGAGADLFLSSDGTNGSIATLNGNLIIDSASGNIILKEDGVSFGELTDNSGGDFDIKCPTDNADIRFKGVDGGGTVTALRLDMSDAGTAIFNSRVAVGIGSNSAPSLTFSGDLNTGIYRPSSDNLGFAIGGVARAFISASQFNMTGNGVFSGSITKGSGSFKIDHPLESKKDTHHLVHSFVEAPQADNIYRGKVDLVDGSATVNLDTVSGMTEGTFILLNTNTQCFTSNETGWTAVKGSVSNNILTITAEVSCTDSISWLVVGERHDQHMIDTEWTDDNGKVIVEPTKT